MKAGLEIASPIGWRVRNRSFHAVRGYYLSAKCGCAADYPGVFIDYVRKDGATAILACVEYDPNKEALQTVVYGNCASDEPTEIVEHYNTDFEE